MLRIVLDTNTIISAFFWKGNESVLMQKIENKEAELYLNAQILLEIREVLHRPKFRKVLLITKSTPDDLVNKLYSISNLITGVCKIEVCRDPKDNVFLECAKLAKADYVVSGDNDLLILKEFEGIKIIKSIDMIKLLEK